MRFYDVLPDMECISGDTLPEFEVSVETAESLDDYSMELILSQEGSPEDPVICKECTRTDKGFTVQLDSADTGTLRKGTYFMHFRLFDENGKSYRKLAGSLYVRASAKGSV